MENISVADATTANILLTEHGVTILNVTTEIFCLRQFKLSNSTQRSSSCLTGGHWGGMKNREGRNACPSGAGGSDGGDVPAGRVTQARQVLAEEQYDGCPTKRG